MEQVKRRRLSAKERMQIYKKYNGHCAYCGCEITYRGMQVDHMRPLRTGGTDTIDNMTPTCRSCNHYKATLDVEGFRKYLGGIPDRLARDNIPYQVGLRFGIITPDIEKVTFYYEEINEDIGE